MKGNGRYNQQSNNQSRITNNQFMPAPIRLQLPNERQVAPVNAYLFTKPEPALVDTGTNAAADRSALQAGLAANGLSVSDLKRVIITHAHVDHFGQAASIAANSSAEIWVSELAYEWLVDTPAMWQKRIAYYQNYFLPRTGLPQTMRETVLNFMAGSAKTAESVPRQRIKIYSMDATLEMGGLDWQVLHTPGHASHQTCYYQPETRQFLSSDMLLAVTPTPVVERPPTGNRHIPGLPRFLDSLDLVESLDIDIVYPGHGQPFSNYREVIARQRKRICQRKAACLAYVRQGCDTAVSLVQKMYADRPVTIQFAGLWMVIGYLDLLIADGRVSTQEIGGVIHYRAR